MAVGARIVQKLESEEFGILGDSLRGIAKERGLPC